jgi:hypothetical protein
VRPPHNALALIAHQLRLPFWYCCADAAGEPPLRTCLLPLTLQKCDARLVARKSAPSSFATLTSPPPPISPRSPRSASPSSLGERLAYIDRRGLPQREACVECQHRGLASRCVVAPRVSSRCGNCLRAGKTCTFPLVLNSDSDSDSDSDSESQEDMIVGGEGNGIAGTEGLVFLLFESLVDWK